MGDAWASLLMRLLRDGHADMAAELLAGDGNEDMAADLLGEDSVEEVRADNDKDMEGVD